MKNVSGSSDRGIYKTVDELGRMVLPKEMREHLDVLPKERVELIVGEDCVILRKHHEGCTFCHKAAEGMRTFLEKPVCPTCMEGLKTLFDAPVQES